MLTWLVILIIKMRQQLKLKLIRCQEQFDIFLPWLWFRRLTIGGDGITMALIEMWQQFLTESIPFGVFFLISGWGIVFKQIQRIDWSFNIQIECRWVLLGCSAIESRKLICAPCCWKDWLLHCSVLTEININDTSLTFKVTSPFKALLVAWNY